jgi:hypothetical protein
MVSMFNWQEYLKFSFNYTDEIVEKEYINDELIEKILIKYI